MAVTERGQVSGMPLGSRTPNALPLARESLDMILHWCHMAGQSRKPFRCPFRGAGHAGIVGMHVFQLEGRIF